MNFLHLFVSVLLLLVLLCVVAGIPFWLSFWTPRSKWLNALRYGVGFLCFAAGVAALIWFRREFQLDG